MIPKTVQDLVKKYSCPICKSSYKFLKKYSDIWNFMCQNSYLVDPMKNHSGIDITFNDDEYYVSCQYMLIEYLDKTYVFYFDKDKYSIATINSGFYINTEILNIPINNNPPFDLNDQSGCLEKLKIILAFN